MDEPTLVERLRSALGLGQQAATITHVQASQSWGVEPSTGARWCRQGRLQGCKAGRFWLIQADQQPAGPTAPARRRPARRTRRPGSQDVRDALVGG